MLCDLLLCVGFLPYVWVSALLFRLLVISREQQLPLHMGQCCRCPEGIKAFPESVALFFMLIFDSVSSPPSKLFSAFKISDTSFLQSDLEECPK